ncbi:hypothetical protein G7046_g9247 [Stylonectria norvegica]|nr:hypothetical protein G7046_g9247 [Stylonectria norvegica]
MSKKQVAGDDAKAVPVVSIERVSGSYDGRWNVRMEPRQRGCRAAPLASDASSSGIACTIEEPGLESAGGYLNPMDGYWQTASQVFQIVGFGFFAEDLGFRRFDVDLSKEG